jgi:hypothetical protein
VPVNDFRSMNNLATQFSTLSGYDGHPIFSLDGFVRIIDSPLRWRKTEALFDFLSRFCFVNNELSYGMGS